MTILDRLKAFSQRVLNQPLVFFVKQNSGQGFFFPQQGQRTQSVESDRAGGYAGWVYVAVQKRASRIAATEPILYDLRGKDLTEIEDSEILALLDKPNPVQDRYQFFYTIELFKCLWGRAPILIERGGGRRILELWPLRPDCLTIEKDTRDDVVRYVYAVGAERKNIPLEDVIMIKEPSPRGIHEAFAPLSAAGLEIDTDTAAAVWNLHLLENFAEPGVVLQTDGKLDDAKAKKVISAWRKRHRGPANAGAVTILDQGLKYEAAGRSPEDMQLSDMRKMSREAIVSVLGVPVSLLTSAEVTFANMETAERIFAKDTLEPSLKLIFGALNNFLVPLFSKSEWLDFESPVAEDTAQKIALASAGEGRWLTVNDCRDIFGYEPLDGGDFIFKPFGLTPAVGQGIDPLDGGDMPTEILPAPEPAKGFLKIPMRKRKGWRSRKERTIIRQIRSRNFLRRQIVEGVVVKAAAKIAEKAGQSGPVTVKIKGAKAVPAKDKKELDDRIKAERMEFLKKLPRHQQSMRKDVKKYFKNQREEVLGNLESEGIPKGAKVNVGNWIMKILFAQSKADKILVEIAAKHAKENIGVGAEAIQGLTGMPSNGGGILGTPFVHDFIRDRSAAMLDVNQVTRGKLQEALHEGINAGEDLGAIRNRISAIYDQAEGFRAETIARTEVGMAQNFGRNEEMRVQGAERKVWVAVFSNTRDSHAEANGQVVRVQDSFDVGNEQLDYPGDPSGSPGEVVNCQCSVSPTLDDLS